MVEIEGTIAIKIIDCSWPAPRILKRVVIIKMPVCSSSDTVTFLAQLEEEQNVILTILNLDKNF